MSNRTPILGLYIRGWMTWEERESTTEQDFDINMAIIEAALGSPNGIATLDATGKVPASQIPGGGGGGTPGGLTTQVQFNDAGSFGGDSQFAWDKVGHQLTVGPTSLQPIVAAGSITQKPIKSYGASGIQRLTLGDITNHYFGDNLEILQVYQQYDNTQIDSASPNAVEVHSIFANATGDTSGSLRAGFFAFQHRDSNSIGFGTGIEGDATALSDGASGYLVAGSFVTGGISAADNQITIAHAVEGLVTAGDGSATGANAVGEGTGFYSLAYVDGASSLDNYRGVHIDAPIVDPGGVLTAATAIHIGDLSGYNALVIDGGVSVINDVVTFNQKANAGETIKATRKTDSAPTGNFLRFRNHADNADLWAVDVTGTLTTGIIPAARISSGLLSLARGGTGVDLSATGSATAILAQDASHVISARALIAADIPSLAASKITSGQLALAQGGTGVDLSGTGGATFVLAQAADHTISARALIAADIPSLAASKITSGQLALAQGGTGVDLSGTGGATFVLAQAADHTISARALIAADIPSLDAAKITAGLLALARGGTHTDLSATGGAGKVLKQITVGGDITVAAVDYADVTGTPTLAAIATSGKWSDLQNATAALTLANGTNATTLNHTSAVNIKLANTTAATVTPAVSPSPIFQLGAQVWSNASDVQSLWSIQNLPVAGTTVVTTNAAENSSNIVTLTVASHSFTAGMWLTLSGFTGNFTYLNGQTCRVNTTTATTILFQENTAHGTQASAANTGTVVQVSQAMLKLSLSGTQGDGQVQLPAGGPGINVTGGIVAANPSIGWVGNTDPLLGFYCPNAVTYGLGIAIPTGSGNTFLQGAQSGSQAGNTVQWTLSMGNNSVGNSNLILSMVNANTAVGLQGNLTTSGVANPAVTLGANSSIVTMTATSGTQIAVGVGYGRGTTTNNRFEPTSGSAAFISLANKYTVNQTGGANGAITGLLVNAVETAVGGTHLLLDLQAGTTGGTSVFAINNAGKATKYNGISTVSNGVPSEYAVVGLTAQGANVAATTAYAVPSTGAGLYRVSVYIVVSRVGTTSTMPDTRITFTDRDSGATITINATASSTGNALTTFAQATFVINAKASTNIQYDIGQVNAYASTGGTSMQFAYRAIVEAL